MARPIMNMKYYQKIDGSLLDREIKKKYGTRNAIAEKIGCSHTMIGESIRRGSIQKVYIPIITELLEKPRDYFNAKEEIVIPVKEVPSEPVTNTDMLIALKKIEALLLSINRKLEGKPVATLKGLDNYGKHDT